MDVVEVPASDLFDALGGAPGQAAIGEKDRIRVVQRQERDDLGKAFDGQHVEENAYESPKLIRFL